MKISSNAGFEMYDKLPDGYRLATLEDFLEKGKRKIGMKFLIQWVSNPNLYQICHVSMNLTAAILKPHLDNKRVFVKNQCHAL